MAVIPAESIDWNETFTETRIRCRYVPQPVVAEDGSVYVHDVKAKTFIRVVGEIPDLVVPGFVI